MNSADWFAKKFQEQNPQIPQQPRQSNMPPMPPSQQPMTPYQQPLPQSTARAHSASLNDSCPDCGSGNYFSIQGAKARCYDCGYPMEQSGSRYGSLTGANVVGDTKASRGNDAKSNWSPVPPGYSANGQKL